MFFTLRSFRFPVSKWSAWCFALLALTAARGFGYSLPYPQRIIVNQAMGKMLNCDFDSALMLCDSLASFDRTDPMADMLRLSAMAFMDLDRNHVSDSAIFQEQLKKTEASVFLYETNHGISSATLTIKGFSRAIDACYLLWHRSFIKGLNIGFDALPVLKEAKKIDNSNADVDLFLGLYNYARADMKRMFWWAFFWYSGDKESGIQSLTLCKKKGQFTQGIATVVLAELAIREKKYQEAEKIIVELLHDFPKSRLVRWTQAKYFEEQKLFLKAADLYKGLADEYDAIPEAWRNALAARLKEAMSSDEAGAHPQADEACEKILSRKKEHDDSITRQIMKNAEKLLGNKRNQR
jgi:tetratricopeptide (TPR) repeat protein